MERPEIGTRWEERDAAGAVLRTVEVLFVLSASTGAGREQVQVRNLASGPPLARCGRGNLRACRRPSRALLGRP
jgi:hypothetical protein